MVLLGFANAAGMPALFWWPSTFARRLSTASALPTICCATFARLAMAKLPEVAIDCMDLAKTLRGQAPSPRQVMPYFYRGRLQAWREGVWKVNLYDVTGRNPEGGLQPKMAKQTLCNQGLDPGEKFDKAASEPEILQRLQQHAEAFERSFMKAAPEFDRVTNERCRAVQGGN